mgnify:FL=1
MNVRQYLQVYVENPKRIKGIATQGRQDVNQWVKSYSVSYSERGNSFNPVKEKGRLRVMKRFSYSLI